MFAELTCVNVADPSALADTYKFALAVEALAVVGIKNIFEFKPIRASVHVVVVALAVNVISPVLFTFPSMVLFNEEEIKRKCKSWSGIEIGTLGYWFVAIISFLLV